MVFIDIHCHMDLCPETEIYEIIQRARASGVKIIISNGVNPGSNLKVIELAKKYPEIKPALGLYPIDALSLSDEQIESELEMIRQLKFEMFALGEVGLDFKEDAIEHQQQITNFQKIINLALEMRKPLIVHSRKAEKEAIEILELNNAKKVIMHCFSGNMKLVERILAHDWYITVPTNVTYHEQFQNIIKRAHISQLFCETDSPYLHPEKNKRNNEPANVIKSYEAIAKIKNLSLEEVESQIEMNYHRLFGH